MLLQALLLPQRELTESPQPSLVLLLQQPVMCTGGQPRDAIDFLHYHTIVLVPLASFLSHLGRVQRNNTEHSHGEGTPPGVRGLWGFTLSMMACGAFSYLSSERIEAASTAALCGVSFMISLVTLTAYA